MKKVKDPVAETIDTYNVVAEDYKKRYIVSNDKNIMQPALDEFLSYLPEAANVLDIGSGAGFDAKYLDEKGCKVTSIDLSEKFIEIAKSVAPNVEFLRMDVRKLKFSPKLFDGIWASASLLHLPKNEILPVLKRINELLKNEGYFYVAMKQGVGEKFVVNTGDGNLANARRFFAYYTKEEFENLLNQSGFNVVRYTSSQNRENIWMNFYCAKQSQKNGFLTQ